MPPFIVTLGTWSIFGALKSSIRGAKRSGCRTSRTTAWFLQIMAQPAHRRLGAGSMLAALSSMLIVAGIVWYVLNRTAFGRHVYATGDDPDAARLAGISTNRTLLGVYALAGLICAVAGWVLIGRIGGDQPAGRRRPPTSIASPPW